MCAAEGKPSRCASALRRLSYAPPSRAVPSSRVLPATRSVLPGPAFAHRSATMSLPSPYDEIRLLGLRTLRGANFWSRRPVTRMDVAPGAYDDVSSAQVAGVTTALLEALPGLWEHRCSIGERGGFVTRLRRGAAPPPHARPRGPGVQVVVGPHAGDRRPRR